MSEQRHPAAKLPTDVSQTWNVWDTPFRHSSPEGAAVQLRTFSPPVETGDRYQKLRIWLTS